PKYPFTAIVSQENVKTALILNAVDPTIGGVLISGPKGSGKSLLVRALSEVLPRIEEVEGCPFHCSPRDPTNMCPSCLARFESGERLPVASRPMRIVQVPLSVTDDMLVGSLDMDKAVKEGVKALRPGLLAEANQNILYIDEVNLLPDHITDSILDAAASGWNIVEREGISVQHPSRFILVGTMNPEEGDLRPQILDRFGVYAETRNIEDPDLRALVVQRNEEFIADPSGFIERRRGELYGLRSRIEAARELLSEVEVPEETYSTIAAVCSKLRVDGFRPDIVATKVARALAAFHGRSAVALEDAAPSIELALGHRTRRSGLAPPPSPAQIREAIKKAKRRELKLGKWLRFRGMGELVPLSSELLRRIMKHALRNLILGLFMLGLIAVSITFLLETLRRALTPRPLTPLTLIVEGVIGGILSILLTRLELRGRRRRGGGVRVLDLSKITLEAERRLKPTPRATEGGVGGGSAEVRYGRGFTTTPGFGLKILKPLDGLHRRPRGIEPDRTRGQIRWGGRAGGRRTKAVSSTSRGRFSWYQFPRGRPRDIALVPTIRVAALHQVEREEPIPRRLTIEPQDIRVKVREYRAPFSIILLVDMSMSMISSIKNLTLAIHSLHRNVYRQRDRVGLIVFKGSKAFTIQHPTTNLALVVKKLKEVGASDFTPMAAGLLQASKVLKQEKRRNKDAVPNLIVFSDGIVNVPLDRPLSPLTRRKYYSEAQADSIDVAHLLAKEKFRVHIINTNHSRHDAEATPARADGWRLSLNPTQFLMDLARVSKGNYYGLSLEEDETMDMEEPSRWFYTSYFK
ncbi:MAG: ATP-binding protein, partial [Candidatus Bathyarchaeia archaeon]